MLHHVLPPVKNHQNHIGICNQEWNWVLKIPCLWEFQPLLLQKTNVKQNSPLYWCTLCQLGQIYETHWRKRLWSGAQCPTGSEPVTNGVPQELVLGLILFNVFISDLDNGAEWTFCKFANDMKVGGVADTADGYAAMQRDLGRLEKWTVNILKKGIVKYWTWTEITPSTNTCCRSNCWKGAC